MKTEKLTITERIYRLHKCMYPEKAAAMANTKQSQNTPKNAGSFDKWNDSPVFKEVVG